MKSRRALLAVAFSLALPALARAEISGFSGFAPANIYQGGSPSSNAALGYSADHSTFTMTDANQGENTTGYYATPQDVTSFTASFNYTSTGVFDGFYNANIAANGIGLVFHNEATGTATLTNPGQADPMGIGGATTSAGLLFNNYGGVRGPYAGSTYFETGGNVPLPTATGTWTSLSPVNLSTGDPMHVVLTYSNGTLRQTITDTVTGAVSKSATPGVNIPTVTGGTTAYVGFVASTGGYFSYQSVSGFTYTPGTGAPAPAAISSSAVFSPIPISGFNHTVVVPASSPTAAGQSYLTATMDSGTNLSNGTGYTFFESGLTGSPAGKGLPGSGTTFTSAQDGNHTFTMPAYDENNDGTHDSFVISAASTTATVTFSTPADYSALSFLVSAGHGPVPIAITVNYANGTSVDAGDITAKDWFFNTPYAYTAGARVDPSNGSFNSSSGNVNLYQADLALPASSLLISSLSLAYDGPSTGSGVAAIFAISGVPVVADTFGQGDLNFDGNIDDSDTAAFILATVDEQAYISTYVPAQYQATFTDADFLYIADFNYDGNVDDSDTAAFILATVDGFFPPPPGGPAPSFSASVPEPGPAALGVAAIGGAGLLWRRRR